MTSKHLILIPVYNEAAHLGAFLKELVNVGLPVWVVDDGSVDGSGKIAEQFYSVRVITMEKNSGKGAALRRAFAELPQHGYEWVILMDADGQHAPSDVPKFLECPVDEKVGIVNGNRLKSRNGMPYVRYWTNCLMSFFIGRIIRQKVSDVQCGFKMLSTRFLSEAKLSAERFEIEDDLLFEAARLGYEFRSVEVKTIYGNEQSHIHPWNDTVRFFRFVMKKK